MPLSVNVCVWGGLSTTWKNWFSLSTMWAPELELKSSDLSVSAFICWAVLLNPKVVLRHAITYHFCYKHKCDEHKTLPSYTPNLPFNPSTSHVTSGPLYEIRRDQDCVDIVSKSILFPHQDSMANIQNPVLPRVKCVACSCFRAITLLVLTFSIVLCWVLVLHCHRFHWSL